jgi:hypothetical protein
MKNYELARGHFCQVGALTDFIAIVAAGLFTRQASTNNLTN